MRYAFGALLAFLVIFGISQFQNCAPQGGELTLNSGEGPSPTKKPFDGPRVTPTPTPSNQADNIVTYCAEYIAADGIYHPMPAEQSTYCSPVSAYPSGYQTFKTFWKNAWLTATSNWCKTHSGQTYAYLVTNPDSAPYVRTNTLTQGGVRTYDAPETDKNTKCATSPTPTPSPTPATTNGVVATDPGACVGGAGGSGCTRPTGAGDHKNQLIVSISPEARVTKITFTANASPGSSHNGNLSIYLGPDLFRSGILVTGTSNQDFSYTVTNTGSYGWVVFVGGSNDEVVLSNIKVEGSR